MQFEIHGITTEETPFKRVWTGHVALSGHNGETPIQVSFSSCSTQVIVEALGGIAFTTIPFERQSFSDVIEGKEATLFPDWALIEAAVRDELPRLAQHASYREVAIGLGWPVGPDPNPTVTATIASTNGAITKTTLPLDEVAGLLERPDVTTVTLARGKSKA